MTSTPWVDFLASFASILLTFLAGAEVDPQLLREKWKVSLLLGGLSFLLPFIGAGAFAFFLVGWDLRQSEIAGVALSTTSLAVVYAVLVETGLTKTEIGKIIMASTFITDLGTAVALSALFIQPTVYFLIFVAVSIGVIVVMRLLQRWFFDRYGDRVIEPEIKGAFAVLSSSCGSPISPRATPSCRPSSSASPWRPFFSGIPRSTDGSASWPSPS